MRNAPSPFDGRHLARSLALHAAGLALLAGGAAFFQSRPTRYYLVEAVPSVYADSYALGQRTELKKGASGAALPKEQPRPTAAPAFSAAPDDFARGHMAQAGPAMPEAALGAPGENGAGGAAERTTLAYLDAVRLHIERAKRYPDAARRTGLQGEALVEFTIGEDGRTAGLRVKNGSGYALLDKEALATVLRANPFPAPTDGKPFRALVEIAFRLHQ